MQNPPENENNPFQKGLKRVFQINAVICSILFILSLLYFLIVSFKLSALLTSLLFALSIACYGTAFFQWLYVLPLLIYLFAKRETKQALGTLTCALSCMGMIILGFGLCCASLLIGIVTR